MSPDEIFTDVFGKYQAHVNPSLARLLSFAGFGVEMRAEGCYLYDHEGRQFLDCLGGYGVFSLGHRHSKIVEAVKAQLDRMPLSGKAFFNRPLADVSERLSQLAPGDLRYSFFCNSGAEAAEGALKFAKGATGRRRIVSTFGGYHGKTMGTLATTGREKYRAPFEPLLEHVAFIPYGDVEALSAIDEQTACFIVEPIQGEGGIIVPPEGYLRAAREACDRAGALLIFDEIQTGLCRTGKFFGCQHEDVAPDLMTLAKSLGGGVLPVGAFLGTPAIWEKMFAENPLLHTSTFGGNELACVAALATLDTMVEERLDERAAAMGARFLESLRQMAERHTGLVAEARGRGLMIGVEFTMDEVGELVVAQMLKRGMCAAYTLNNPRVLRIEPPLIISEAQIDQAVEILDASLTETQELLTELVEFA